MREGQIVRVGTPAELTTTELRDGDPLPAGRRGRASCRRTSRRAASHELTAAAVARGEELEGLEVRRPTLEDVYLELTADEVDA